MKRDTILIVDDVEINRWILSEIFRESYQILEAADGVEALEKLREHSDAIAVMLLDLIMPGMDGYEILDILNRDNVMEQIPVILITGDNSEDMERKGFDLGVSDIIPKPFDVYIVKKRVQNVVEMYLRKNNLEQLVDEQTSRLQAQARKLMEVNNNMIDTISELVEFRNMETGQHVKNIKVFTGILAEKVRERYPEFELDDHKVDLIRRASAMHDIGKIMISDTILMKPGRLTAEEYDTMKTHTTMGCVVMDTIIDFPEKEYYDYGYQICRYHHERYDGGGYPDGLVGEEIPIAAQIVSVADVYEALISPRVYKPPFDTDTAFRMIINGECGTFSPKLVECLTAVKDGFAEIGKQIEGD